MCTGIRLSTGDDSIVHGRTVDFGITIDATIAVVPRDYQFVGQTPLGDGLKYAAKYAAVGWIAFTDVKLLDSMNEAGLAAGAFFIPTFAEYSAVTAENQDEVLSPAGFPNWLLTQFASVDEVRRAIQSKGVVITPTVMPGWGAETPPAHYIVYDKTGASIVIEPVGGELIIHNNPLGAITNAPAFDWHMTILRNYTYIEHKIKPVTLSTSIVDSGTIFSYIVPWNVNGAFAIGAMGIGLAFAPYAFLTYLSLLVTIVLAFVYLIKKTIPADENAQKVYGTEPDDAALPSQRLSA